ncbi:kinase-like domain-containing protein [Mucor mucedo]|uniref:kinase-like domain-containing protein n=1 Tax=Mucor mucedo TaxID=29922 RepID=UPI0022206FFD|nr:kinase-like domain-containing protein [Mucor mucedo]KAI7888459.1 kinase-like domain-containing protein [Mucor mucedo]
MVIDPPEPVAPITPLTTSTATATTVVATTPVTTPAATPVATPAATPVTTPAATPVTTPAATPAATETAPPHTTSATTLTETKKPSKEEEDARVAEEIDHLMKTVKGLPDYYKLIDKIGEGTFSTVYKALDIRRDLYHNGDWEPQLMESEEEQKTMNQYVALKRIYHTSSPRRIANEVYILRKLIGSPCISPLITAFRQQDQVFVVMPYIPHDDFKKTFHEMPMLEIKSYMKALLTALHYLHKQNILHRDVKPNNFLYNRRKRTGYLIDFGLAENEEEGRKLEEYTAKVDAKSQNNMFIQSIMGYVKNDARHQVRANRAGTRGFRAPEILMKVTRQTCAIDIWAAGVILSCFLTGRYPFFLANEESDAMMELAQIYGYREMKKCASSHGRTFSTNINIPLSRIPWFKLVEHLNKEAIQSWDTKDYKDALDLLDKCMDLNPKTRITATDALQHPFFSS